ncbi:hypothetical protein F4780DRAFT_780489 [Xylariomycetidae sp. FL0641]|nr:hypothetical protein F4780DRAFT_780489 [Xylariomycetidae sp. FL0641]
MSASSHSNPSTSPTGMVDPLDLLDFSEYDTMPYQSPSVSPSATTKSQFARPTTTMTTTPPIMPASQPMSGPSHQYDQYKQQTPFVPGALASTLAVNENNAHITGYTMDYLNTGEDMFDFNAAQSQHSSNTPDMEVDFDSSEPFFLNPSTVNPHAVDGLDSQMRSPTVPSQTSNVGRMYPGMHQQAALAKAQAQQRQQQQIIRQQQQQQQQRQSQQGKQQRPKVPLPADPIVEQKITQLLNTMRSRVSAGEDGDDSPLMQIPRPKKEEDEMDEDERLLASEEGKKLSSKERRQLRNKVSARAFRSRRKEYISQLEAEIANKVTENGDLRAQNRALADENRRLSDLTRMLLSSPSFSNFLDHLSSNPQALPQAQPQVEQRQPEPRQAPKDVNPYAAVPQGQQQQQIGMVMMPEQAMDFSMLNINSDAFNYQPRVFTVSTLDMPVIDTEALTGKSSNFVGETHPSDEKMDAPVLETPMPVSLEKSQTPEIGSEPATSEKLVADLDGDIFDDDASLPESQPTSFATDSLPSVDLFGGVEPEKAFARYELVDASEEEAVAGIALRRVERLAASLEATVSRLDRLYFDQ